MTAASRVEILGILFDNLTRAEAAAAVVRLAHEGGPHYVVKPYSEFMPRAFHDPAVARILNGASLCLPDGAGILWAAHYLSLPGGPVGAAAQLPFSLVSLVLRPSVTRRPLRQAMQGVDFTWAMLEAIAHAGLSVFFLGGTREEVAGTVARVSERLPALRIAGQHHGYFAMSGGENDAAITAINAAKPDVLLVALGFPRQERWIAEYIERLEVKVVVAEGGSFSFVSGATRRAPEWMRRAGLEWLFRLLRQPARLRRQLALPQFVWLVFRARLSRQRAD